MCNFWKEIEDYGIVFCLSVKLALFKKGCLLSKNFDENK